MRKLKNKTDDLVDKENPDTWKKFTKTSCKSCAATCCTMPIEIRWEDMAELGIVSDVDLSVPLKTVTARLIKEKIITAYREDSGLFALKQTRDGKCIYLVDTKCIVYSKRPLVCREFPIRMGWRHGYCPQKPKAL